MSNDPRPDQTLPGDLPTDETDPDVDVDVDVDVDKGKPPRGPGQNRGRDEDARSGAGTGEERRRRRVSDVPGDDVPEYPGEGDRDEYIHSDDHRDIEDIDDDELDQL